MALIIEVFAGKKVVDSARLEEEGSVIIGRLPTADIVLAGDRISEMHARITETTHGWHIRSLEGKVQIEGAVQAEKELKYEDSAAIGPYLIKCRQPSVVDALASTKLSVMKDLLNQSKASVNLLVKKRKSKSKQKASTHQGGSEKVSNVKIDNATIGKKRVGSEKVSRESTKTAMMRRFSKKNKNDTTDSEKQPRKRLVGALAVLFSLAIGVSIIINTGADNAQDVANVSNETSSDNSTESTQVSTVTYTTDEERVRDNYLSWVEDLLIKKDYSSAYSRAKAAYQSFPNDPEVEDSLLRSAKGLLTSVLDDSPETVSKVVSVIEEDQLQFGVLKNLTAEFRQELAAYQAALKSKQSSLDNAEAIMNKVENLVAASSFEEGIYMLESLDQDLISSDPKLNGRYASLLKSAEVGRAKTIAQRNEQEDLLAQFHNDYSTCLLSIENGQYGRASHFCGLVTDSPIEAPEKEEITLWSDYIASEGSSALSEQLQQAINTYNDENYPQAFTTLYQLREKYPDDADVEKALDSMTQASKAVAVKHISAAKSYLSFGKSQVAKQHLEYAIWVLPLTDNPTTKLAQKLLTRSL